MIKYKKYLKKYKKYKRLDMCNGSPVCLPVKEPWLGFIKSGVKTVEGRLGSANKYTSWIGKTGYFFNRTSKIQVKVIDVRHYKNLYDYLDAEGFDKVLPGIKSRDEAINIYHQYYPDDLIARVGGMCGIVVQVV